MIPQEKVQASSWTCIRQKVPPISYQHTAPSFLMRKYILCQQETRQQIKKILPQNIFWQLRRCCRMKFSDLFTTNSLQRITPTSELLFFRKNKTLIKKFSTCNYRRWRQLRAVSTTKATTQNNASYFFCMKQIPSILKKHLRISVLISLWEMIILLSRNFNSSYTIFFFSFHDHIKVIAFLGATAVVGGLQNTF